MSMILSENIVIDGDTALVVTRMTAERALPEPAIGTPGTLHCGDCDGPARRTFNIEYEYQIQGYGGGTTLSRTRTLRVHVIDVLPICDPESGCPGPASPHICWSATDRRVGSDTDGCWLLVTNTLHDASPSITLPPDAAPGMWLVRLAVHQ